MVHGGQTPSPPPSVTGAKMKNEWSSEVTASKAWGVPAVTAAEGVAAVAPSSWAVEVKATYKVRVPVESTLMWLLSPRVLPRSVGISGFLPVWVLL